MTVVTETDPAAPYIARFAEIAPTLPGGGLPWFAGLRETAIGAFAESGFPTIRSEAWKYTDLRRMLRTDFTASPDGVSEPAAAALTPWRLDGGSHLLVFVDGRFAPSLSGIEDLPPGARLISLDGAANDAPALLEDRLGSVAGTGDGLMALNTAFMATGGVLHVDDGVALEAPVQLLFLATAASAGAAVHPRNLIVLGKGASATVVETYAGADGTASWTNGVTEIVAGQGARLEHFKLQREGDAAWHTALVRVRLLQDAAYRAFVMSTGARLARNEFRVRLEGRGAACRLDGATLLRGRQHADNTTEVVHAALDGASRQTFKGVLDGESRSVFQGRVLVEAGAQRTDAHQINRNLLLSPHAEADSKPELVIHADDVKCSHGATTGDLDREALFYMRARGIDPAEARALLIEAFMVELIEGVTPPAVQAQLAACLDAWLGSAAIGRAAA